MQAGFNCLVSHNGIMLLMLPLACKGLAEFAISTLYDLVYMLAAMPLRCIKTLWYMLDIPHGIC